MKLQINNLVLFPDHDLSVEGIQRHIQKQYNCPELKLEAILRKSLDGRKKNRIHYLLRVVVSLSRNDAEQLLISKDVSVFEEPELPDVPKPLIPGHVVIVGSGPAGLFAALRLLKSGLKVTLLERGKNLEARSADIKTLEETGTLNPESNVVFGEGGAGTYSDGKLTARTRRPESTWFYETLVNHGADPSVKYEAKPHIGTDALIGILRSLRQKLLSRGGTIHFSEKITELIISGEKVRGIRTASGREFTADAVILATGHSARDTYAMLRAQGITMEQKGFALGVRVEHPAELIREIQYGTSRYRDILPPAEYALAWNNPESRRGTYSFCMCPGGRVINSSSEKGLHCVNGMSLSDRGGAFSNAALVVSIPKETLRSDLFSGIALQQTIEAAAWSAGAEGKAAPAQRLTSFLKQKEDVRLPVTSYLPKVEPANVRSYLPADIADELAAALPRLNNKMKGFITDEAILIGSETRTSSPLRITRGEDFSSVSHRNLFPAGEGSGYAGGIVSSAVDGIRVADAVITSLR